jgi:hypothetical protein
LVDVTRRRLFAHKTATTLQAHDAAEIIEQVIAKFGLSEIANIDQGSQFTALCLISKICAFKIPWHGCACRCNFSQYLDIASNLRLTPNAPRNF